MHESIRKTEYSLFSSLENVCGNKQRIYRKINGLWIINEIQYKDIDPSGFLSKLTADDRAGIKGINYDDALEKELIRDIKAYDSENNIVTN